MVRALIQGGLLRGSKEHHQHRLCVAGVTKGGSAVNYSSMDVAGVMESGSAVNCSSMGIYTMKQARYIGGRTARIEMAGASTQGGLWTQARSSTVTDLVLLG